MAKNKSVADNKVDSYINEIEEPEASDPDYDKKLAEARDYQLKLKKMELDADAAKHNRELGWACCVYGNGKNAGSLNGGITLIAIFALVAFSVHAAQAENADKEIWKTIITTSLTLAGTIIGYMFGKSDTNNS